MALCWCVWRFFNLCPVNLLILAVLLYLRELLAACRGSEYSETLNQQIKIYLIKCSFAIYGTYSDLAISSMEKITQAADGACVSAIRPDYRLNSLTSSEALHSFICVVGCNSPVKIMHKSGTLIFNCETFYLQILRR